MSTLLMVSGASRGLGSALAVAFAKALPADVPLDAILMARSTTSETEQSMKRVRPTYLETHSYAVDLSNLKTLEETVEKILQSHPVSSGQTKLSKAILVNCAGTTGYIGRNPSTLKEIQLAADLNFTSKAWLSARFIKEYECLNATIINISSISAVKATPTMALYCATSAGREMFHTTLARDQTNVRIINYAPGPCNTNLQTSVRESDFLNPSVRAYCQTLVAEGGLVDCEETAAELVRLVLDPAGFESGERVEFVNASAYKY